MPTQAERYSPLAQTFHWVIAGLIIVQFTLARLATVELLFELQRRAHTRDQFDAVERLGDVIGGTGYECV